MNKILKFSELTEAQKKESIEMMQNWKGWDDLVFDNTGLYIESLYNVETLSRLINESIVTDNESLQWFYSNLLEAIEENNQEQLITTVYGSLCLNIDATIRLDQVLGCKLGDDNYTVHISNRDLYKIVVTPDYEQSTLEFDRYTLEFISDIENVLNQLNDLLLSKTSYEQLRFEVEQDTINEYSNMLLIEVDNNNNIVDVNLNC